MNVIVKIIPHSEQRYETVGDWYFNDSNTELFIMVSDMGNWKYNFLVAFHEQVEATLCLERGISEESVSNFDIAFEASRLVGNYDEPGDSPIAPYHKEHLFATHLEKLMAVQLGVDWKDYDDAVNAL